MNKIGHKYGNLTVTSFSHRIFLGGHWRIALNCKCDCGNEVIRISQNLVKNRQSSCGCLTKERITALGKVKGKDRFWNYKHGMFGTRFYSIYSSIYQRCYNKKSNSYRFYGAIGIKSDFKDFNEFKKTMYKSYTQHIAKYGVKETTIDRIDSTKNYSPSNCKWSNYKEQANNRKDNLLLEYNGIKQTLSYWANKFNTSNYLAFKRITGLDYNKSRHVYMR